MENNGAKNNFYHMPHGVVSPIESTSQPGHDEKLSSNQMQASNQLRYIPNLQHVPIVSASGNQVPHHSKEIHSYFLDTNYQAISTSSVHNWSQHPKIATFNGNPSLPANTTSFYPQYLHAGTFHDGKYHSSSGTLNHNHMVVSSQTTPSMSPVPQSYYQRVNIPPTQMKMDVPISSLQQKSDQSNTKSSLQPKKETMLVNTPSQFASIAKDQTVCVDPSISTGFSTTHHHSLINKTWPTSHGKSNPINYGQEVVSNSSSYNALRLPAFQNMPTNQPSIKISTPSANPGQTMPYIPYTMWSSTNGCTSNTGDTNTVNASLVQTNSSKNRPIISDLTTQSKVITSTTYNHHKLACDLMKKSSSQTQQVSFKNASSVENGDESKTRPVPQQKNLKHRRRISSCDIPSAKVHVNTKRRRHRYYVFII